jgi:predicted alternative tryptophan synthase beta-subunit
VGAALAAGTLIEAWHATASSDGCAIVIWSMRRAPAGQWGTALSIACSMFDLEGTVYLLKARGNSAYRNGRHRLTT